MSTADTAQLDLLRTVCADTARAIATTLGLLQRNPFDCFAWETLRALLAVRFAAETTSFQHEELPAVRRFHHEREHQQLQHFVSDIARSLLPTRRDVATLTDWWFNHSRCWDPADHLACRDELTRPVASARR
jgi:hypothetical protein